jgi:hypothetical protein
VLLRRPRLLLRLRRGGLFSSVEGGVESVLVEPNGFEVTGVQTNYGTHLGAIAPRSRTFKSCMKFLKPL